MATCDWRMTNSTTEHQFLTLITSMFYLHLHFFFFPPHKHILTVTFTSLLMNLLYTWLTLKYHKFSHGARQSITFIWCVNYIWQWIWCKINPELPFKPYIDFIFVGVYCCLHWFACFSFQVRKVTFFFNVFRNSKTQSFSFWVQNSCCRFVF